MNKIEPENLSYVYFYRRSFLELAEIQIILYLQVEQLTQE